MSDQNRTNQSLKKICLTGNEEVFEDNDFFKEIELRIKDIDAGKITGATWEEVKAKSKL